MERVLSSRYLTDGARSFISNLWAILQKLSIRSNGKMEIVSNNRKKLFERKAGPHLAQSQRPLLVASIELRAPFSGAIRTRKNGKGIVV